MANFGDSFLISEQFPLCVRCVALRGFRAAIAAIVIVFEEDPSLLQRKVKDVMTIKPTTILQDKLAVEAFAVLKDKKIDELPVVDEKGRVVGLLDIQDLLKAGLY